MLLNYIKKTFEVIEQKPWNLSEIVVKKGLIDTNTRKLILYFLVSLWFMNKEKHYPLWTISNEHGLES